MDKPRTDAAQGGVHVDGEGLAYDTVPRVEETAPKDLPGATVIPFPSADRDDDIHHVATIVRVQDDRILVSFDGDVSHMLLRPEDAERLALALIRA